MGCGHFGGPTNAWPKAKGKYGIQWLRDFCEACLKAEGHITQGIQKSIKLEIPKKSQGCNFSKNKKQKTEAKTF